MFLGTVTAVVIILVGVAFFLKPPNATVDEPEVESGITEFELLMRDGSPAELARESRRLSERFAALTLPEKVAALKKRLELNDRLLQMDEATDAQIQESVIEKVNALAVLTTLNHKHDLQENWVEKELIRYAKQHQDSPDEKVQVQARLALAFGYVQTYVVDPSEENFNRMRANFIDSAKVLSKDGSTCERFLTAVRLTRHSGNEEHANAIFGSVGDILKQSPKGNVWLKGARLKDLLIFGMTDFSSLEFKVSIGDQTAIESAYEMIEKISTAEEISPYAARRCLRLVETLERSGHKLDVESIADRFRARSWGNEFGNKMMENLLSGHDARRAIKGKQLKLIATDLNGNAIDFSEYENKLVALIFVSFNNSTVMDSLGVVANLGYLQDRDVRIICCEAIPRYDPNTGLLVNDQIKVAEPLLRDAAQIIPFAGAEEIIKQHPVITTPYIVILDRDHKALKINVKLDELRAELEGLLKRKDIP